jgi:prepilin-type N-terminal cleavage/methylation domain-containing protein
MKVTAQTSPASPHRDFRRSARAVTIVEGRMVDRWADGSRRMQQNSRIKQKYGFTLVEVAVATAVMALVITTSITVLARGFNMLDTARCLSYASQILQSELEKMRLSPWGSGTTAGTDNTVYTPPAIPSITSYSTTPTVLDLSNTGFYNAGDTASRMTLTRTAADVHTGMIQVTFQVSWNTIDGRPMHRSYTTYYGQKGLYDFISQ